MSQIISDRFRKSIALIYNFPHSIVLENEQEFIDMFIGENIDSVNCETFHFQSRIDRYEAERRYPFIMSSMKWLFAVDNELNQILKGTPSYETYKKLDDYRESLQICITALMLLDVNSDDSIWTYKYNVNRDLAYFSSEVFRWHKLEKDLLDRGKPIEWMHADGLSIILDKLICSYFKDCLSLIKLQIILCIIRFSPVYDSFEHAMADELFFLFRDLLYNKRICMVNVNQNIAVDCAQTTRFEIIFALNNDDRYCFRVDFQHKGNEYIHLNLNAPGKIHNSVGFPTPISDREEIVNKCNYIEKAYEALFFEKDEMIWFRSAFKKKLREIKCIDDNAKEKLSSFYDNRKHIRLNEENWTKENCKVFERDFFESISIYGFAYCDYKMDGQNELSYFTRIWYKDWLYEIVDGLIGTVLRNKNETEFEQEVTKVMQLLLCRIIDDKLTKLTYDDVDDFSVKELIEIITEILLPTFDEDSC